MMTKAKRKKGYFSISAVAEMFSVSKATIWNWTKNIDIFPKPSKLSSNVTIWKLRDLNRYMDYVFGEVA